MGFTNSILVLTFAIAAYYYFTIEKPSPLSTVKIRTEKGWERVGEKFKELVAQGEIKGSSISIRHKGKEVVNIVGGYADKDSLHEWDFKTLSVMFSSSKIFGATVVLHMIEKNLLSLNDKIIKFWPEFGKNGKENTTVSDVLAHKACLFSLDKNYDPVDLIDNPGAVESVFEDQKPVCEIGKDVGYHTLTYGALLDIIVRRVDPNGRHLSEYFREEIAIPNDLDTFIGLPYEQNYRATRLGKMPRASLDLFKSCAAEYRTLAFNLLFTTDSHVIRSLKYPKLYFEDYSINNPEKRRAPDACCNGYSTASSMSKFLSLVQSGKILSPKMADQISKPLFRAFNLVLQQELSFSYGYYLIKIAGRDFYGHAGAGGQSLYADKENDLVFAYLSNYPTIFSRGDDPRFVELVKATYESFESFKK